MNDVQEKGKKHAGVRRQRSIYQVHYGIRRREEMARPLLLPSHAQVRAYGKQVAGHTNTVDTKFLGLLQCSNGTILKPIIKESQKREVEFYTRVSSATDADLVTLRSLVPKYFGCTLYTYKGHTQEYIMLEDVCERMLEPCIMDVKIGRRTWDPLASEAKIKNEQKKYSQCKQQYAFCIPGFQVYQLGSGRLCRYNKDYGKRLHSQAVIDAIRTYLNGAGRPLCRALVLQLLSELWRLQRWARRQARLRLYGASLLLVYDAARLRRGHRDRRDRRDHRDHRPDLPTRDMGGAPPRRRSVPSPPSEGSFSGQLSEGGPLYSKLAAVPLTPLALAQASFAAPPPVSSSWTDALEKLNHNHSFDHNYEDKVSKIKMNYRATLDQLSAESPAPSPWGTVKIIDFAHAFFNEEDERALDDNFREGVDNFVAIFECFLRETDDQIN